MKKILKLTKFRVVFSILVSIIVLFMIIFLFPKRISRIDSICLIGDPGGPIKSIATCYGIPISYFEERCYTLPGRDEACKDYTSQKCLGFQTEFSEGKNKCL